MVTLKLMTVTTTLVWALVGPLTALAENSDLAGPDRNGIASEQYTEDSAETFPEMRASIVEKDGDEFVAMTEEGQEFRLPVQGAPSNINVGDELRLIPDAKTQTIQVFKAEPPEREAGKPQDSQL